VFRYVLVLELSLIVCAGCVAQATGFLPGEQAGTVRSALIREASGIVASRKNPGILWVHNDSGDSARVYAIATTGELRGIYNIKQARSRDWEDIAIGPGPEAGQDYLYVGDIGDNRGVRDTIAVYRVPEPSVDVNGAPVQTDIGPADSIELVYPDEPKDAETLMVDPLTGDIYIVTKRELFSRLYRAAHPQSVDEPIEMELVGSLPWGFIVGGDISPTGDAVILRGMFNASMWARPKGEPLCEAFQGKELKLQVMSEPQGEGICFDADGKGYFTIGEMMHPPIYYFGRSVKSGEPADAKSLADIVGVTHVAGRYHLTEKDFLNEGADQILALGSRVIKVWFYGKRHERPAKVYPYNSDWPRVDSLVEGAQTPYYRRLFNKPFTSYILVVTALGRDDGYWRNGISEEQKKDETRQFYELAKYLLTAYKDTGKTFVLQHWEGDWMLRGSFDAKAAPTRVATESMIEWLNARQAGVNKARQEIGHHSVRVYHAAEVNRVVQSMRQGVPNMVNKVLPHTDLDLVSYSAWDAATAHHQDPQMLRDALNFIASHAPDSADFGDKNVYIGEFGMPENLYSAEQVQTTIPNVVRTGLDWGCPYIIYWQLYCNELRDATAKPPVKNNDAVRGFWLIRPDGSKAWTWNYFFDLLNPQQKED